MQPVFIVDDVHKKAFLEKLLDLRVCVSTNGLLYDLPSSRKALGVDIEADFQLTIDPRPRDPKVVGQLLNHRARPIVIVTSPTEEGSRIAQQVIRLLDLAPDASVHLALPALEANLLFNYKDLLHKVDPNYVAQYEARRVLERLSGFMFTEFLKEMHKRNPRVPYGGMDRYSAYLLAILAQRNASQQGAAYRVLFRQPGGFEAYLVDSNSEDADLSTLQPVTMPLAEAERIVAELKTSRVAPALKCDGSLGRFLPSPPPLYLAQAAAHAREQDLYFEQIGPRLTELYSTGLTSHFLPVPEGPAGSGDPLHASLQQHFRATRATPFASSRNSCKHLRGVIRPLTILQPGFSDDYPKLAAMYSFVQMQAINHARQPLSYSARHLLFQWGGRQFLGYNGEELAPDMLKAAFFKAADAKYVVGSGFTVHVSPASRPIVDRAFEPDAPALVEFLSTFHGQYNGAQILSSLHHLTEKLNYLHFHDGDLHFTEAGTACAAALVGSYGKLLSAERMAVDEKALRAIGLGREDKTFFLHSWYNHFRSLHERVMDGLESGTEITS